MTTWTAVLLASALAFALKYLGHLVPASWLDGERTTRITSALPIALLAALVGVQTLTTRSGGVVVDSRAAAVGVAIVALLLRAPFIVVVVLAAAVAAGLRALGLP
ncbi:MULTISPECIES: AzlD domain-containing protein [unclassified Phycicoccus]|uniref:AzlD domain-containing protein n=1 Tax=unclassified Phycicoccus TaxID=2637926 RepID=UPI0007025A07|nr:MULTISPECIES: AzlD domain-containing protein [unclassified Phycicoccus]KQU66429.1 branched-chain amino acid transporter AzlD [Phycicoccus sp. Root101]KQZ87579.1 branched-chain amino acid transporter AzlD [Phycicoccus sp. Root563]